MTFASENGENSAGEPGFRGPLHALAPAERPTRSREGGGETLFATRPGGLGGACRV